MTAISDYWRAGVLALGAGAKALIDNRDTAIAGKTAAEIIIDRLKNPLG